MADGAAVDAGSGEAAAGRWTAARRRSRSPGGDRVPGASRLILAQAAGNVVRDQPRHRASAVHRVDPIRIVGTAAPKFPGPVELDQRDRLVLCRGGLDRRTDGEEGVSRAQPGRSRHAGCEDRCPVRRARHPAQRADLCGEHPRQPIFAPAAGLDHLDPLPARTSTASPGASPAKASTHPNASAVIAGSLKLPIRAARISAASSAATTARPNAPKPSPTLAASSSATAAGPRPPSETPPRVRPQINGQPAAVHRGADHRRRRRTRRPRARSAGRRAGTQTGGLPQPRAAPGVRPGSTNGAGKC